MMTPRRVDEKLPRGISMTEATLRRAVLRLIRKKWPNAWVLGGRHSVAGVADLNVCYQGKWIALELKRPGRHPTPLQRATLEKIRAAGGAACVIRSVKELPDVHLP